LYKGAEPKSDAQLLWSEGNYLLSAQLMQTSCKWLKLKEGNLRPSMGAGGRLGLGRQRCGRCSKPPRSLFPRASAPCSELCPAAGGPGGCAAVRFLFIWHVAVSGLCATRPARRCRRSPRCDCGGTRAHSSGLRVV